MFSKQLLVVISVRTPSTNKNDAFLIRESASLNPAKKLCDKASFAAFCIDGQACSMKMGFAFWVVISRISSFSSVVKNESEIDRFTADAGACLVVGFDVGPSEFDTRVASGLTPGSCTASLQNYD